MVTPGRRTDFARSRSRLHRTDREKEGKHSWEGYREVRGEPGPEPEPEACLPVNFVGMVQLRSVVVSKQENK